MKTYGQFCSIARALDLLGERWTLLIVRELLCGSRRFGEVQRGIPRISRTMLAARLRELVEARAIERLEGKEGPEDRLTPAGEGGGGGAAGGGGGGGGGGRRGGERGPGRAGA